MKLRLGLFGLAGSESKEKKYNERLTFYYTLTEIEKFRII